MMALELPVHMRMNVLFMEADPARATCWALSRALNMRSGIAFLTGELGATFYCVREARNPHSEVAN